jgi:hypothetical protein
MIKVQEIREHNIFEKSARNKAETERAEKQLQSKETISLMKQQFIATMQFIRLKFLHYCTVGLKTHLLSKFCAHKKIASPLFW